MNDETRINRHGMGHEGECRAADFLIGQGFQVVERNYRGGRLAEIDIVARCGDLVVFVEVKRRESDVFGGGLHAVGPGKKRRLRLAAQHYLKSHPGLDSRETVFRFDLVAVSGDSLEWIKDIIR